LKFDRVAQTFEMRGEKARGRIFVAARRRDVYETAREGKEIH
jgi:hypothetical protein